MAAAARPPPDAADSGEDSDSVPLPPPICGPPQCERFPGSRFCGCTMPCRKRLRRFVDEGVPLEPAAPSLEAQAKAAEALTATRRRRAAEGRGARLVTWNVLFDPAGAGPRWEALLEEVAAAAPDVVCFQEAVPCFARLALAQAWAARYFASDGGDGRSVAPEGELVLVGRWLAEGTGKEPAFSHHALPSDQGRRLVVCELRPGVAVATAHFESLAGRSAVRREQLELAQRLLAPYGAAALLGDFNCLEEADAESLAGLSRGGWADAWPSAQLREGADAEGLTYDPARNALAAAKKGAAGGRLDRAFLRGLSATGEEASGDAVLVRRAWLLGAQPLAPSAGHAPAGLWPSDHFGLGVDLAAELCAA